MKAVVTVLGSDKVGIIAKVTAVLAQYNVNILDITQTIMQNIFTMIMLVDILNSNIPFSELVDILNDTGKELGVDIKTQHEDIFKSMQEI
ncbi:MAG: ACT domain-containing protein [Clostridia bacterium]|nr:ACT domain-containing protein [Clostridia bacterium]MBQ4543454.1 ACT domain-containing protein [Clostridia bacterium]MBQ7075478.1 ACT domain-containing protein [Clostridia bacterium]